MKANEARDICHCGEGTLDFKSIADVCKSIGVKNVFVEQDRLAQKQKEKSVRICTTLTDFWSE